MATGGIEKFFKKVPSKKKIPSGISPKITQSGDFQRTEGIDEIIKGISNILMIAKETYFFDSALGCDLYKYVFDPVDISTKTEIEQEISQAIFEYENRAEINYDVLFFKNKKGFRVNIYVKYRGEKRKISINIDETLLRTVGK